jgi:hypothetical protein
MYLTLEDFKKLIFSNFTNEQAEVIAKHLDNKCFFKGEIFYTLTPHITYRKSDSVAASEKHLLNTVSQLLERSYNKLTDIEKTELSSIKKWTSILTNASIKTYFPQLIVRLTKNQILDDYFDEMHFMNGVYSFKDGSFKKRQIGTHFITYCIGYDYEAPTKKQMTAIKKIVKKTFPLDEDYDCICTILASALTGRGIKDQTMLFLLGEGSSGKSNILELTELTVQEYFLQLKADAFAKGTTTVDKMFNTFSAKPYIRVTWVNEMIEKTCDSCAIKQFNDGKLQTVKLYADGAESFEHRSKLISTANTLPQLIIDSGVARRVEAYTASSKFVENESDVDESNHIYLKDKHLLNDVWDKGLHIAWFQTLADYAQEWLETRKINYTENFTSTKIEVINTNDTIKDFVDGNLIFTTDDSDRISKKDMMTIFKHCYPDKHLTPLQLLSSLKEKKVKYSNKYRIGGIQGCYYCVKLVECDEDRAHDDDTEIGVDKSDQSVDISKEYTLLLQKYNALLERVNKCRTKGFGFIEKDDDDDDYDDDYDEPPKAKPKAKPKVEEEKVPRKKAKPKPKPKVEESDESESESEDDEPVKKSTKKIKKSIESVVDEMLALI